MLYFVLFYLVYFAEPPVYSINLTAEAATCGVR